MIFKIRASGAGDIMTNPKSGTGLSVTCKKYLRRQWVQDNFKRVKEIDTPAMRKGILNEGQGITMLAKRWGEMLRKNYTFKENDHMTGTSDVIHDGVVADIKCNTDIFTFMDAELDKDYELQLQVYMNLWDLKKAALVYVLTDTPDNLIVAEAKSITWRLQDEDEYDTIYRQLKRNLTYSDIPEKDRIKIFEIEYDQQKIDNLVQRVESCREFYNSLSLTPTKLIEG